VGASHSTFSFAFGTLRHLRTLLTLRFPKGLAWCCDLLLLTRHIGFGCVTRRSLSGRWHFDLLYVSNGHNLKNRPHGAENQDNSRLKADIPAHRRDCFAVHESGSGLSFSCCARERTSTEERLGDVDIWIQVDGCNLGRLSSFARQLLTRRNRYGSHSFPVRLPHRAAEQLARSR
jgi:hypothetical protein